MKTRKCDAPFGMIYELNQYKHNSWTAELVFYSQDHGRVVIATVIEHNQRLPNVLMHCQKHLDNALATWIEKVTI